MMCFFNTIVKVTAHLRTMIIYRFCSTLSVLLIIIIQTCFEFNLHKHSYLFSCNNMGDLLKTTGYFRREKKNNTKWLAFVCKCYLLFVFSKDMILMNYF
ncbi:hypothetical protein XENTR_v10016621 [Xenopus tropicalis]|nr:hypothetical protein XENTR_v10016621 [Xenopus tropicalis]